MFVETNHGFINARKIVQLKPGKRYSELECYDADGVHLGTITRSDIAPLIPDHTGTVLVEFWQGDDPAAPEFVKVPVIAWNLADREPVTCEFDADRAVWCLELRTGFWLFPNDRSFTTFAHARQYAATVLLSKQREKERRAAVARES